MAESRTSNDAVVFNITKITKRQAGGIPANSGLRTLKESRANVANSMRYQRPHVKKDIIAQTIKTISSSVVTLQSSFHKPTGKISSCMDTFLKTADCKLPSMGNSTFSAAKEHKDNMKTIRR
ncbi:MAG: hypothetical protein MUC65_04970 [Pontiellaceae bacterium]|nr:hypothetical protein [Pontiellaceae bacterium]